MTTTFCDSRTAPDCIDCGEILTLINGDFHCVACADANKEADPTTQDVADFIMSKFEPRLLEQSLVLNPAGWLVRGSFTRDTCPDGSEKMQFTLGGRTFHVRVTEEE